MKDGFEKYLHDNREKLETGMPSPQVWQKLQAQLTERHQKKARIVRIRRNSLAAAASVVLFAGIGYFVLKSEKNNTVVIGINASAPKQTDTVRQKTEISKPPKKAGNDELAATEQETRQSLFYYARLIQIRQNQIKRLQVIDPDLYKESQQSVNDLNKIYDQLQRQLSGSINQERVLEEMIENLQMQEKILSNQLQILKGLPPSNQSNDEKSVKEI